MRESLSSRSDLRRAIRPWWMAVIVATTSLVAAAGCASGDEQGAQGSAVGTDASASGGDGESDAVAGAPGRVARSAAGDPSGRVPKEPLVVALPALPEGLDPLGELDAWGWRIADDLVFEGLVKRTPDKAPWVEMALADRCETDNAEAARTVTCHLRPGVEFHDGAPVTPDDVLYSLDYWLDPRRSWAKQRRGLSNMSRVELVDGAGGGREGRDPGRWVRVTFSPPQPLALELLSEIKVVPRQLHRGRGEGFAELPVGTGPMRVLAMESDRWFLETVPGWRRGELRQAPSVSGMVIRGIDDAARSLTLLRRGEVHWLAHVPEAYVPGELGKPGMAPRFRAYRSSPPLFDVVMFNTRGTVTDSNRIRQALEAGIPLAKIERDVYGAPGLPLRAPVDMDEPMELDLAPIADLPPGTDVLPELWSWRDRGDDGLGAATAGAVLDQLGWEMDKGHRRKSGNGLRITLTWNGAAGRGSQLASTIRDAWTGVGIIVPYATAHWNYLLTLFKRGEFEAAMVRLAVHDDADLYPWFHSRGDVNFAGIDDARLDAALVAFRSAQTRAERHVAEREVARRLAELRVATVLHAPLELSLVSRRVTGVSFADDLPRLDMLGLAPPSEGEW